VVAAALVLMSAIGLGFKEMVSPRRNEEHEEHRKKIFVCSSFLRGEFSCDYRPAGRNNEQGRRGSDCGGKDNRFAKHGEGLVDWRRGRDESAGNKTQIRELERTE
jgi:hypothetical protein